MSYRADRQFRPEADNEHVVDQLGSLLPLYPHTTENSTL